MRFFLISDNIDTQIGLRLAGIKGVVVHERDEIIEALRKALNDPSIGVILVTQKIAEKIPDEVERVKLTRGLPLLFVIPDRHGWKGDKNFITRYIEEAIGVRIDGQHR